MSARTIPTAELPELLSLIGDSDSVELKATVPDSDRQSMVQSLEMDPMDARSQRKGGDSVVKLRSVVPSELPKPLPVTRVQGRGRRAAGRVHVLGLAQSRR
jgi:hypothetical protein